MFVSAQAQTEWPIGGAFVIQSFIPHSYVSGAGDVSRWVYSWERCQTSGANVATCTNWAVVDGQQGVTYTIPANTKTAGTRWNYRRCSTNNDCSDPPTSRTRRVCTTPVDLRFF